MFSGWPCQRNESGITGLGDRIYISTIGLQSTEYIVLRRSKKIKNEINLEMFFRNIVSNSAQQQQKKKTRDNTQSYWLTWRRLPGSPCSGHWSHYNGIGNVCIGILIKFRVKKTRPMKSYIYTRKMMTTMMMATS